MRCAVCGTEDNVVVNVIMADASSDPPPLGCYLVEIQEGVMCDMGWVWDGTVFINPNPPAEPEPEIPPP